MRLDAADIADLRPLIAETVRGVLAEIDAEQARLNGRIAYPEAEAAALLGVPRHVLRDARLRGEIAGRRVGKRIVYSRDALTRYVGEAQCG